MTATKNSDLSTSVNGLLDAIGTSGDAVSLLRSLAAEVPRGDRNSILAWADRIERGATDDQANDAGLAGTEALSAVQSIVRAGAGSPKNTINASGAARFAKWQSQRGAIRRRLFAIGILGAIYLITSLLVGGSLIRAMAPIANELEYLDSNYNLQKVSPWSLREFAVAYYAGGLVIATLFASFWWRVRFRSPAWNEWLWDQFPFLGSTLRAMDLSEKSQLIHCGVSVGWTYPEAFRAAASQTRSSRLRGWLRQSVGRFEAGESLAMVVKRLPMKSEWLGGWLTQLSPTRSADAAKETWFRGTERMHQLAVERMSRTSRFVPPMFVVVSVMIACVALIASFGKLIETISWLT